MIARKRFDEAITNANGNEAILKQIEEHRKAFEEKLELERKKKAE